jgi:hypothetical protein
MLEMLLLPLEAMTKYKDEVEMTLSAVMKVMTSYLAKKVMTRYMAAKVVTRCLEMTQIYLVVRVLTLCLAC